ncbi:hypothetical protein [Sorangium sp. So ce1151]|uniref:hypothetical protein n=1 Tax=Sorangium sp. So ce1151 TaxID=3133332 RepID=UPI003F5EA37F
MRAHRDRGCIQPEQLYRRRHDRAARHDQRHLEDGIVPNVQCHHEIFFSGQAVSWWQYAPDYTYIASVGGIEGCFRPVARPQGSTPDIGAYERPSGG